MANANASNIPHPRAQMLAQTARSRIGLRCAPLDDKAAFPLYLAELGYVGWLGHLYLLL